MALRLAASGDTRFRIGLAAGAVIGIAAALVTGSWQVGLLGVVIGTAAINVGWALLVLWPMDPAQTAEHAEAADVDDEVGNLTLLLILIGSLTAIGILLVSGRDEQRAAYAGLSLIAILLAWAMLQTMYTARYARIYYQAHPSGGINFNNDIPPRYVDFYYFSFNLGMTYQVSDTNVETTEIRADVLRHSLMSYIYGTVVIACAINLVINLLG